MPYERLRWIGVRMAIGLGVCGTAALGQTIDVCGQLLASPDCSLFQADTGGTYALDASDGFALGDRVRVVGTLNNTCEPACPEAIGCITTTLVGPCGVSFSACGTLVQAGTCVLFDSDTGDTYVVDQTGTFTAGDRVEINGTLHSNCTSACSPSSGCVTVSTVNTCGTSFTSCGLLVQRGACAAFTADHGGTYALDSLGGFAVGDRVRVSGTLDLTCTRPCATLNGCIRSNTVSACGTSFSGCGTLIRSGGCVLFSADGGGTYLLDNLGMFSTGARVRVSGALGGACPTTCASTTSCIADNTIEACETTFSGCGTLFQGVECVLFSADSGGTYVLDTLAGFVAGDRVYVTGTLDLTCVSICMAGNGCIHGNTITAGAFTCSPTPTTVCATTSTALLAFSLLGLLRGRRRG